MVEWGQGGEPIAPDGVKDAMNHDENDGRDLVAAVREAARKHNLTWEMLVPDAYRIDASAEAAEDAAYAEMAQAKHALRDHICATYGLSIRELSSLAMA